MAASDAACREFEQGWESVPRSAFLAWAPSMLSLLDSDVGATLVPLLEVCAALILNKVLLSESIV